MAKPVLAAADVSRSFVAGDSGIVPGSLVSAQTNSAGGVELANTTNDPRLVGVATPVSGSLLAIDASTSKVQVAISGTVDVLVSTINGDIQAGDQITVSPLSGIGMDGKSGLRAIGLAQQSFSARTVGAQPRDIKDKNGALNRVYVGTVPVSISIAYASTAPGTPTSVLGGLQLFASGLSGHQVSTLQTSLSFLIVVIAVATLIGLLYGAIHGSLVSIGRNPLARTMVHRSLAPIIGMAVLVVLTAAIIVYLTLR